MTEGIKAMKDLGYIETINELDVIVRQFIKYDGDGRITDVINYFYNEHTGVGVFTNSLKHGYGSRLDKDILNAVIINLYELEHYYKGERK